MEHPDIQVFSMCAYVCVSMCALHIEAIESCKMPGSVTFYLISWRYCLSLNMEFALPPFTFCLSVLRL